MGSYVGGFFGTVLGLFFDLYMFLVIARFLMQIVRADFRNPFGQFILTLTNPVVIPIRRIIPSLGKWDIASLIALFLLQMIFLILVGLLPGQSIIPPPRLFIVIVGALIDRFVFFYGICVVVVIVISWLNPMAMHHPIAGIFMRITEPFLGPIRRRFPPINGFDLSPLFFIVVLIAVHFFIAAPIIDFGRLAGSPPSP